MLTETGQNSNKYPKMGRYTYLNKIIKSLTELDKIPYAEMEDGFDTIYDLAGGHEIKVCYNLHIQNDSYAPFQDEIKQTASIEITSIYLFKNDNEIMLSGFENELLKEAVKLAYHESEEKILCAEMDGEGDYQYYER